ncbi:MAG: TIGR02266 family protein [Proteobacteria bacterium]|nr:TIGR02266 family protein [Pseudomonadota bacterium]
MNSKDSSKGKAAAIRARLKFPSQQAFIKGYAPNISKTGIFIKTPKPKAVGVRIKFEFQIADGTPVLRGIGEVSWNRAEASEGNPPGMGIKFLKLDAKSRQIVEKILEFKGEQEPVEKETVKKAAPVEAAPAPVEATPVEEATEEEPAEAVEKAAAKTRARPARRRRAVRSTKKKDAAGDIDFGAIDSMLAQISADSEESPKRVAGRRARRGAAKEQKTAPVTKEPSVPVTEAAVQDREQMADEEIPAEAATRESRSDSGISAVNGQEPTFEPSIEIKLDEVLELEPETSVEIDPESGIMLRRDSKSGIRGVVEAYTEGEGEQDSGTEPRSEADLDGEETEPIDLDSMDGEKKVEEDGHISIDDDEKNESSLASALADELNEEEEETDQSDLAFPEKENSDEKGAEEDVPLIPLDDDDEREEDQNVKVIPVEDEDSEVTSAIASIGEDDVEETDIEGLLDEEDDGEKNHVVKSDEPVGDFMDDMDDGESVLPPAATESLLQNTEVEEALDDIFQMASGKDGQPETADSEPQHTPESGETVDQSDGEAEAQTMESEVTQKVDAKSIDKKKKKGFFKKLFG